MKIFIVDDNIELAQSMADILCDHHCKLAHDGKEASEILAVEDFDLVITDIDMPAGGGERILCELSVKDTPVFVYTAEPKKNLEKYKSLGAQQVFFKPNVDFLLEAILRLANKERNCS